MHGKSIAPPESPSKLIPCADGRESGAPFPGLLHVLLTTQSNPQCWLKTDITRLWPRAKSCLLLAYIQCKSYECWVFFVLLLVSFAVFAFPSVWEQSKRIIFCNTWRFCEIPISVSINTTRLKYSHGCFCTVSGSFWTRKPKMFTIWCLAEEKI